jgi:hypothetical protein
LKSISFYVKTNVPLSIKVGISPYGFIYHGPGVNPYYEWPEAVRKSGPYPDPYQRGLPPEAKGDLRSVLLKQRRPELYRPRVEPKRN